MKSEAPPQVESRRARMAVNVAVLLFGSAGLFAKWIQLPALQLAMWRVSISFFCLLMYNSLKKQVRSVSRQRFTRLVLAGILLAIHWWLYIASIQISTVAVGVVTFVSFPLFVTFLEPLFFTERLLPKNVLFAFLILAGVLLTIPEFRLSNTVTRAILLGLISALSYAALSLLNRRLAGELESTVIALYEQGTAVVVMVILFLFSGNAYKQPASHDFLLVFVLGSLLTAVAHTLYIQALSGLTARYTSIISALEVVYAVILAWLLLGERPTLRTIAGGLLILSVVIVNQWFGAKESVQ